MRYLIIFVLLQGCSQKHCEQIDFSGFAAPITAPHCDTGLLSDIEMQDCVAERDLYPRSFYDYYGLDGPMFIYEYPANQHLIDEQLLTEFGTYLLAESFNVAAVDDKEFLVKSEAIANYLLINGVDPFQPYKTEMAPVAWLIPNLLILRSVPATKKRWEIVKIYYPPERHEVSKQVDLYLRYCSDK